MAAIQNNIQSGFHRIHACFRVLNSSGNKTEVCSFYFITSVQFLFSDASLCVKKWENIRDCLKKNKTKRLNEPREVVLLGGIYPNPIDTQNSWSGIQRPTKREGKYPSRC
mgnify:FL=1